MQTKMTKKITILIFCLDFTAILFSASHSTTTNRPTTTTSQIDICSQFQARRNHSINSPPPIPQLLIGRIKQAAAKLSQRTGSMRHLCNMSIAEMAAIFHNLSAEIHTKPNATNSTIGEINQEKPIDFFACLRLLVHEASNLKQQQCINNEGMYDATKGECRNTSLPASKNRSNRKEIILQLFGNITSIVCLCLLIITYCIFKELRTIPGQQMIYLTAFLAAGHLLQTIGIYATNEATLCQITGILAHFSYLTTFSFMAAMVLNMSRTFCSSGQIQHDEKLRRHRISLKASILTPLTVVVPCVIINYVDPTKIIYGDGGLCFVSNTWASLVTFVIPVGAILVFNFICLVTVTVTIYRAQRDHEKVLHNNNNILNVRARILIMTINLANLTGLGWIFGFISGLTQIALFQWIFIALCSLQGVFVFIGFCCNKRIINLYKRELLRRCYRATHNVSNLSCV